MGSVVHPMTYRILVAIVRMWWLRRSGCHPTIAFSGGLRTLDPVEPWVVGNCEYQVMLAGKKLLSFICAESEHPTAPHSQVRGT